MLDHYQIQLTRMLEAEQYDDARELLQFLLHCQGEDERHYEEWRNLLNWLDMAFPQGQGNADAGLGDDEESIRRQVLDPGEQDEAYVQQVLYIMKHHPMIEQQMLALERAVLLRHPGVDEEILDWLTGNELHPVVQFKALQCLRKRGLSGQIHLNRLGEQVELEIEMTPLTLEDFPGPVIRILERVEQVTEVFDPTLPHFAREMWKECLQFLYGTSTYAWMLREDDDTVDCFAASLHLTLLLAAYGSANDDEIRETYGITDALRFRYEQACRVIRQVGEASRGQGDDSEP
ncbi:hypothetical protein [Paenibacillus abyssi]|uniref:PIK helical domain-containing protein n=1 Tax=Paenibacillus abyssi TaxID=1340531 RepID=A0A917LG92_9BACL|nr:hypothetical protein [Paenibacillus abyssi]GGG20616.1 hypothetical protein GCM10010916_41680 [Paenibacillus abyssi]